VFGVVGSWQRAAVSSVWVIGRHVFLWHVFVESTRVTGQQIGQLTVAQTISENPAKCWAMPSA